MNTGDNIKMLATSRLSHLLVTAVLMTFGTLKDDRTVLYKTKSLDGTKPITNPNPNSNPIQLFYAFS